MRGKVLCGIGLLCLAVTCLFVTVQPLLVMENVTVFHVVKQFSYMTEQVITLSAVYLFLVGLALAGVPGVEKFVFHPAVKVGITAFILTVGVSFYAGIVPFAIIGRTEAFGAGALHSVFMHAVMPLVMLAVFFFTPFTSSVSPHKCLFLLIYPACYMVYLLFFTKKSGLFLYPFLDVSIVGKTWVTAVCFFCIALGAAAIVTTLAHFQNRFFRRSQSKAETENIFVKSP